MQKTRRISTVEFKAQVAIEALWGRESLAELAKRFELHPNQVSSWKHEFQEHKEQFFGGLSSIPLYSDWKTFFKTFLLKGSLQLH